MREDVELPKAYKLLNHGPTVIVSAAHGGRRDAMAAAWSVPLEFEPARIAVVLDKSTFTRGLVEASGEFALSVPCRAFADATFTLGTTSGHQIEDKLAHFGIATFAGRHGAAPLLEGCVAWLECRLVREPHTQQAYDIFIGEVLAASADTRAFSNGRWHFGAAADPLRTIHHVGGGHFLLSGEGVQAAMLKPT